MHPSRLADAFLEKARVDLERNCDLRRCTGAELVELLKVKAGEIPGDFDGEVAEAYGPVCLQVARLAILSVVALEQLIRGR